MWHGPPCVTIQLSLYQYYLVCQYSLNTGLYCKAAWIRGSLPILPQPDLVHKKNVTIYVILQYNDSLEVFFIPGRGRTMLSRVEFIRLSLELNLFFARIAKEHSIFMETSFTSKDSQLAQEADSFKLQFEMLLAETLQLANGIISPETAKSGELVTPYTLSAERVSQFYTGVPINSGITQAETALAGGLSFMPLPMLEERVYALNQKAMMLTTALARFKTKILSDVLACKLFTTNYPLLLDHILREAKFYLRMLSRLQNREDMGTAKDLMEQEVFWNRIMAEHAKFIRGLLDPTEEDLFNTADKFGKEFDKLTREAVKATEQTALVPKVTGESLEAAKEIRDFKASATKGSLDCKIKSIAYPLLADHVLREANHYIRILKMFGK